MPPRSLLITALPLGLVLLWVVTINLALNAASAASIMDWLPDRQTGTGYVEDNRQRAQAAVREYKTGQVRPDEYLAVLLGISNAREGVQLDILNPYLGPQVKLLGQAGAGAGAASIVENAAVLDTDLKPDLALVGIAPAQMLDPPIASSAALPPPATPSVKTKLKEWLTSSMWLFARRVDLVITADRTLQEARAGLLGLLKVNLPVTVVRSPWRPMMRTMFSERFPDKVFVEGLASAEGLGTFDAARYGASTEAPQTVSSLIMRLRARGSKVVIFLTPEHSMLRSREPANVATLIRDRLRAATGDPSIVILDFRSAVDDRGFVDLVHLNTQGSRDFSATLGKALGRLDRSRPPLMAAARQPAATQPKLAR